MKKILFLEYKFREFSDEELSVCNPFGVMACLEKLDRGRWNQIERVFENKGVSFVSLPGGDICPTSKAAKVFLFDKIGRALNYSPDILWFDHLRFEGHWEKKTRSIAGIHGECKFCKGKYRPEVIFDLAKKVLKKIPKKVKTGYFAVPYIHTYHEEPISVLGQDHQKLGNIFDFISPMLYHRMIGKPASYIGEYVRYLSSLKIKAKIIPIVQLKDMPDDIPDKLRVSEINEEIKYAAQPPSEGVAVFSWDQAIEKNKLRQVSDILRTI